ncbi:MULTISPECIES: hypothetical protein [Pseudomonas]|uniref:hypothetical protein n=1 Tax=Pseudomonas TaxID=286 RepID=UPI0021484B5F|nr:MULTISPECIES: hypothetical protein [Pseudomonas]UUT20959.1 hypothetical protein NRG23_25085 [Pseudomonas sp. T8]WJV24118.1 hypothetical protein PSR66_31620 [Pseudomonas chlororaphis]
MKPATFKLDRHVFELLKDGHFQQFTTRSLRDGYALRLNGQAHDVELWRYIYDQIQRLKRVGWITQDPIRRKRDQVFHVMDMPEAITPLLVDHRFSTPQIETPSLIAPMASSQKLSHGCPTRRLESLAKEIRLDMLTALGEAERYKQLFTEMPVLKARVEDDYIEARDRSSRLLGHLRAIENTLKLLVAA